MRNYLAFRWGIVALLALSGVITGTARLPKGVVVHERTPVAVSFSYVPNIRSWDTVTTSDGSKAITPSIDGAQIRISPSGTDVQWVVDLDVIVPGPTAFRIDRASVNATELQQAPPFSVQLQDPIYWRGSEPLVVGR